MGFAVKTDRASVSTVPTASLVTNGDIMNDSLRDEDGGNFRVPIGIGSASRNAAGLRGRVESAPVCRRNEEMIVVGKVRICLRIHEIGVRHERVLRGVGRLACGRP